MPGDRPDRFDKALRSEADAVIVDLEDAVSPARKAHARAAVAELLGSPAPKPVFVRVNSLASALIAADLEALAGAAFAGVRLPKVEAAEDVAAASALLDRAGLEVPLWCLIESARGLEFAFAIASCARTAGISLGEADLRSSLRVPADEGLDYARARCVAAARAAGLGSPMQSVYPLAGDEDGLRASTERGKAFGLFGRAAVHPAQVATINDVFTPTAAEVGAARELVAAFEAGAADGSGAVLLADGRFVDRAVAEQARNVLELVGRVAPAAS